MSASETKDDSPFPSASTMDLDMWKAGHVHPAKFSRPIEGVAGAYICEVYGAEHDDAQRDATARRLEMMGDLYETLRRAAEKMAKAGLDVSEENQVLGLFVAPKPFARGSD